MIKTKVFLKLALAACVLLSACSNVFEQASKKDSDEALYEEARTLMDEGKYSESVEYFEQLGPGFASRSDVLEDWAGALAGECGMTFFPFLTSMSSASLGGSTLFKFLMAAWTGKAVIPASCAAAEAKIRAIWAQQTPTQSQKLFMALLSMAKMGAYIRSKADVNGAGSTGDGTVDPAYNSCVNTDDANHLTDAEIKELVTGFSLLIQNFIAFGAGFSPDIGTQATNFQNTICPALTPNPCATTEVANVTSGMVDSMRDLLKSSAVGLEACNPITPLCCP